MPKKKELHEAIARSLFLNLNGLSLVSAEVNKSIRNCERDADRGLLQYQVFNGKDPLDRHHDTGNDRNSFS